MSKYLDENGLLYLWAKIKSWVINLGYLTSADVPEGSAASSTTPKMNGTASSGSEDAWSRGDHIHPTDTSRAPVSTTVTGVTYDGTNKKFTKTINGSTTDVVSISTIKTDLELAKGDVGLGNVTNDALIPLTLKGAAEGVCPLDSNSKVPAANLPSYVDDVVEAYPRTGLTRLSSTWLATGSASGTVITPESGVIYVLMTEVEFTDPDASSSHSTDTITWPAGTEFRWGGTSYVKINDGGLSSMTNTEMDTATNNWT